MSDTTPRTNGHGEIVPHAAPHRGLDALGLMPTNIREAIELAKFMASAKAVPQHLQGDVGSCLMVVEQAMRWGMSPFAVAQCTSSIKGKLMYEGKLVAAAIEAVGAIDGHLEYTFSGEGDDRTVVVSATRRGETEPVSMPIRLGDVRTNNEWWGKQPDQQLVYSAARNWARRFAPAVMLGVYSPEEWGRDVNKTVEKHSGPTIDGEVTDDAEASDALKAPPPPAQPATRPASQIVDAIEARAEAATTMGDLDSLERDDDVRKVREHLPVGRPQRDRLETLLTHQRERVAAFEAGGQPGDDDIEDHIPEELRNPDADAVRCDKVIAAIAVSPSLDAIDRGIIGTLVHDAWVKHLSANGRMDLVNKMTAAREARIDQLGAPAP